MKTALENEFTKLTAHFAFSMLDIEGFHADVELAMHSSRTNFLERSKQHLEMGKSLPVFAEVLQIIEESFGSQGLDSLVESTTQNSLESLRIKSDAASVVFGHSLLDALLFKLCKLSYSLDPGDWFPLVSERQVKVEQLLAEKPDLIVAKVAQVYVDSLERKPLNDRATLLHSMCRPTNTKEILPNYTYSESDLKDFDQLRHKIVHGMYFRKAIPEAVSLLAYARQTGIYFINMVGNRYNLQPRLSESDLASINKPDLS